MGVQPIVAVPALSRLHKQSVNIPWAISCCLMTSDIIALSLAYWVAVLGRYAVHAGYELSFYLQLFPSVLVFIGAFLTQDLYPGLLLHPAEELRRVFRSVTTVFLLIGGSTFLWRNADSYSRSVFLITWACGAPVVLLFRKLTRHLFANKPWWGVSTVVFGSGAVARRVLSTLHPGNHLGLRVVGVLTNEEFESDIECGAPVLGAMTNGPVTAARGIAQYAILAIPEKNNADLRHAIQEYCVGFRHVLLVPDLPGLCCLDIVGRDVGGELGFELPQRLFHASSAFTKRLIDTSVSFVLLLALLPLFVLVSVLIKLTSRGPVFFRHFRFGRDGEVFAAWKFRTMVANNDEILRLHLASNPAAREEWNRDRKLRYDPRVTSVGKWLRRCSFDEFPQLWNVLIGNMSLVGPRPIVKAEIDKYGPSYGLYKRVVPGITGLWQVSGRNNTTYQERVAFDEYYVRNWSVWLDAYILACTVRTVLTGDGAY